MKHFRDLEIAIKQAQSTNKLVLETGEGLYVVLSLEQTRDYYGRLIWPDARTLAEKTFQKVIAITNENENMSLKLSKIEDLARATLMLF